MNKYALTLILKPEQDEKTREELLKSIKVKFGKLEKEEIWGNRDFTYSIQHLSRGYYVHYFFEAEPNKIAYLDKDLKIDDDIIRHLLVRV